MNNTFDCPACGEEVPVGAKSCPHCGACEKTGWNEEATRYDGLDLPDEDFDYSEFVKEEFGSPVKPRGIPWRWWVVGIAMVLVLIAVVLGLFFR